MTNIDKIKFLQGQNIIIIVEVIKFFNFPFLEIKTNIIKDLKNLILKDDEISRIYKTTSTEWRGSGIDFYRINTPCI